MGCRKLQFENFYFIDSPPTDNKGFSFIDPKPKKDRINAPAQHTEKNRYKLVFNRVIFFREYAPLHGRWLSIDPAGYPDGYNVYHAYMDINGVDVLGLEQWVGYVGPDENRTDIFKMENGVPKVRVTVYNKSFFTGEMINKSSYWIESKGKLLRHFKAKWNYITKKNEWQFAIKDFLGTG